MIIEFFLIRFGKIDETIVEQVWNFGVSWQLIMPRYRKTYEKLRSKREQDSNTGSEWSISCWHTCTFHETLRTANCVICNLTENQKISFMTYDRKLIAFNSLSFQVQNGVRSFRPMPFQPLNFSPWNFNRLHFQPTNISTFYTFDLLQVRPK